MRPAVTGAAAAGSGCGRFSAKAAEKCDEMWVVLCCVFCVVCVLNIEIELILKFYWSPQNLYTTKESVPQDLSTTRSTLHLHAIGPRRWCHQPKTAVPRRRRCRSGSGPGVGFAAAEEKNKHLPKWMKLNPPGYLFRSVLVKTNRRNGRLEDQFPLQTTTY